MVLMRDGSTEKGHDSVSAELVDGPLVPVDLVHEDAETPIHDFMNRLRIEVLEHGRGVGNIRKEDGNEFTFAFDGAAGRENLFCKMLWGVRMRLVIVQRLGLFRLAQIMAAFTAELFVG